MGYDPLTASDPTPRKFKNTVEFVVNEIISMAEAVQRGRMKQLPEGLTGQEPYWDLHARTLDARRTSDGQFLEIHGGTKLFDKEGKRLDNTQRPFLLAKAFAGLGIRAFPGDPQGRFTAYCVSIGAEPIGATDGYDPDRIVGNKFVVEMQKMEVGRDVPLPVVELGRAYIYTGAIRDVKPREGEVNESGQAAPAVATLTDLGSAPEVAQKVLGIVQAQNGADGDAIFEALRAEGIDNRFTLNGESVLGIALNGDLAAKLAAANIN